MSGPSRSARGSGYLKTCAARRRSTATKRHVRSVGRTKLAVMNARQRAIRGGYCLVLDILMNLTVKLQNGRRGHYGREYIRVEEM